MKVSVIIPIYNTDEFLRRCVDSVLDQDFDDYEILLIDEMAARIIALRFVMNISCKTRFE